MWLAHLLTLSRLPLALLFWFVAHRPVIAFGVLAVSAGTDIIDGIIARFVGRRRQRLGRPVPARIGEWLDPLCDKTFVLSVLFALWIARGMPAGLLLAIATRELILVPLALLYRFTPLLRSRMHYRFKAGALGKATTVVQFLAMTALLFGHARAEALAMLAAVVGGLAALVYIRRGLTLARDQSHAGVVADETRAHRDRRDAPGPGACTHPG